MRWIAVAVVAVIAVYFAVRRSPSPSEDRAQAAVLADGFVTRLGSRVVEYDFDGTARTEHALNRDGDVRVFGTRVGAAAAWKAGSKVHLERIADGEDLGDWGTRPVRQLCDGVATNDYNFAVGWLETDNRVWIVYGPVGDVVALDEPNVLRTRTWCGVASAGEGINLFWREGDKLQWQRCTKKGCTGLPAHFALAKAAPVLGVGCLPDGDCLFASRDRFGKTELAYVTAQSKVKWRRNVGDTPAASIAAIGNDAFAVGYDGMVIHFDRKGTAVPLWVDDGLPAVAWSHGKVIITTGDKTVVRSDDPYDDSSTR